MIAEIDIEYGPGGYEYIKVSIGFDSKDPIYKRIFQGSGVVEDFRHAITFAELGGYHSVKFHGRLDTFLEFNEEYTWIPDEIWGSIIGRRPL
jgi:hypothetical protein